MWRPWSLPCLLALLLVAVPVHAQQGQGEGEAPIAELTPPSLTEFVEADYPPEAEEQGLEASVIVQITIAADGTVTDVEVLEPAGHGFDEAAVEAVRRFVFEPARRGDEAIPSRIQYRYVFELREEPAPEPPPEEAPEEELAEEPPEEETGGEGGEEGLPEDLAILEDDVGFGATARVERPPREVTRRTITREELTRVPGTRGDALRTVELLPGVGRPAFGSGNLIVRGSAPQDSQTFLEGAPVPLLYHFGGLTSFINSRLLDRIDFYPGNFSARYGRKIGGILEVGVRDPATDSIHGVADINLLDASVLVEGPVGDNVSVAVAARRSYIDFFFENVVPEDLFDVVAAPVYYDYQAIVSWRPTTRDRFRAMVYGSSDELKLVFSEPPGDDATIQGDFGFQTQFHHLHLSWRRQLTDDVEQEIQVKAGPTMLEFALGETIEFDATFWQIDSRAEWTMRLTPGVRLIAGMDIQSTPVDLLFRGPAPQQTEGNPDMMLPPEDEFSEVSITDVAYRPGIYVEADLQPIDPLRVVLGLRLDWYREIESWSYDPRMVAIWSVDEDTRIKGGVGVFSQPPEFQESTPELGNPNLRPLHAMHTSAGFERDLAEGIQVGAEGFYKYLWDRVVGTENGLPPRFVNDGVGRIYGLELSGRVQPTGRDWFGFLSYTLSRSERRDREGEPWRLFDFDQTHILSVAGVYRLGAGWEAGATFRLVSGNPYTPIERGLYDPIQEGSYTPVYGEVNSERNPLFHRLDVRVEKKWTFADWKLALYLDVQNVYNSTNPEGRFYNFDFTESAEIPGLPIIPSIGLRGEL